METLDAKNFLEGYAVEICVHDTSGLKDIDCDWTIRINLLRYRHYLPKFLSLLWLWL